MPAPPLAPLPLEGLPPLPELALAVVGHVELVTFLSVDHLPSAGEIIHARSCREHAAGGGAVTAVQLARLTGKRVPFYTALGKDPAGQQALEELKALGLELHVAWRDAPTRRGVCFTDASGERTITVIGERLVPSAADLLDWQRLQAMDGVFVTAADAGALRLARRARVLTATPRVRLPLIQQAEIRLDALIGSLTDPGEYYASGDLQPEPHLYVGTNGGHGGIILPGGAFSALKRTLPVVDTYGAGDCFAAGVTTGLAAGWGSREAISLGCHCGIACLDGRGPYAGQLNRERLMRPIN